IGWGLVGLCPGPALVNLAALSSPVVAFVAAMTVGMGACDALQQRRSPVKTKQPRIATSDGWRSQPRTVEKASGHQLVMPALVVACRGHPSLTYYRAGGSAWMTGTKPGHDEAERLRRGLVCSTLPWRRCALGRPVTARTSEADAQSGAAADQRGIVREAEIFAGREQRHVTRLPFKAHAAKAAPD